MLLFNMTIVGPLPWGSSGHDRSENPVNNHEFSNQRQARLGLTQRPGRELTRAKRQKVLTMERFFLMAAFAATAFAPLARADITVGPSTLIVTADDAIPPETRGAEILAQWLGDMFGTRMETVSEKQWDRKTPAILLGWTKYLAHSGFDLDQAGPEEWYVRAMKDGNVVVAGGRPRGTLYGVYEFLEIPGCRYFGNGSKHVPNAASFKIAGDYFNNRKPFFERRYVYTTLDGNERPQFFSWNKQNFNANLGQGADAGFYNLRQNGSCHTFYGYGITFPEQKPEYFSLVKGERLIATSPSGPGNLCMWHPDVRKYVKEEVARRIAKDKAECEKNGCEPIRFYHISANDNYAKCQCQGCAKLEKRFGTYGGVTLDFINDVAGAFPDYHFITFAYHHTEDAPTGNIRARDNVLIQLACSMSRGHVALSPMTAPANAETLARITAWKASVKHFDYWDYRKLYNQKYPALYTNIPVIKADLPFLAAFGVSRYFAEMEYGPINVMAFHDLGLYLDMRLLDDPHASADVVIDDFMGKYYGAAGPKMKSCLDYLVKRQTASKQIWDRLAFPQWDFLDSELFDTYGRLLDEAEELVKDDPERLDRVKVEYVPFGYDLLTMWNKISREGGTKFTFDKKVVADRLAGAVAIACKHYRLNKPKADAEKIKVQGVCNTLRLPDGLPKDAVQILPGFTVARKFQVDDKDAAFGKAACYGPKQEGLKPGEKSKHHERLPCMGFYSFGKKKSLCGFQIASDDIPQDEKYHVYKVGRFKPLESDSAWAHWTWRCSVHVNNLDPNTEYEAYYLIKLEGPSYVKGSTKPDAFYVDRAIFVPVEKN